MLAYIFRRLLLVIPTLFGIMLVNFAIVQIAPGGPIERLVAEIQGEAVEAAGRISGNVGSEVANTDQQGGGSNAPASTSKYRGAQGLDPEFIEKLDLWRMSTCRFWKRQVEMVSKKLTSQLFSWQS